MAGNLKVDQIQGAVMLAAKSKLANALEMFRPTKSQEQFFLNMGKDDIIEMLLGGGNRCLHGSQEIYDPVLNRARRVDSIDGDFHVNSLNPETGNVEIKKSCRPFVKGFGEMWKVTLSTGETIVVTPEHRVVDHTGHWISIRRAWEQSIPLACVDTSKSSVRSNAMRGRNKKRQGALTSVASSSSSSIPEAPPLEGKLEERQSAVRHGAETSSSSDELFDSMNLQSRRVLQKSVQEFSSSTSRKEHHGLGCFHSDEQQRYPAKAPQGISTPCSRTYECSRKNLLSRAMRVSDRYTCDVDLCLAGIGIESFSEDAQDCFQTVPDSKYDYPLCFHSDDAQPPLAEDAVRDAVPSLNDVARHTDHFSHSDVMVARPEHTQSMCEKFHASIPHGSFRPEAKRLDAGTSSLPSIDKEFAGSLGSRRTDPTATAMRCSSEWENLQGQVSFESSHPSFFKLPRDSDACVIIDVQTSPPSEIWDITVECYSNYSLVKSTNSVISANSGKSLSAAVAITAILLNKPVIFNDGTKHYLRPQRWRDESIKVWIVSYDWKHTGKTIFRLLFKEGAFRMVRDPATNKWRAWNPTNPEEPPRNKTKKCPPLIRFSDIKGGEHGISYENAKEFQISSCEFEHDGTRLECFASTGKRPQGDPANLIWIDEKIADEGWYNELMSRTIDDQGRIMWTAWPDTAPSDAMTAIADRAKEQEGKPNQFSYSIELDGDDNPFTKSQHRDNVFSTMDEESRNARAHGILNKDRWRIYSRFSEYVHTALKTDPTTDDDLAKSIREVNGIPATWTRYLILDPGTVNPAVLFVAVPPPSLGDYIVPYDELYLHNTPAKPLSEAIAARTKGTYFEDFIADSHACRMTPMGFDGRVGENYEKEFARVGLLSRRHGARFTYGSDNVAGRILRLQGNLNLETRQNNDGKMTQNPRLRVMIAACPILVKQLKAYKRGKDINNNPIEEPAKYQAIDMAQCAEYFCSRDDLGYHAPVALRNEDPKSRDVVMKTLGGIFGRTPSVKTQSQSVYCGSGEVSEYM